MTGKDMIETVRPMIFDTDCIEYDDAEMLNYLNTAITYLSDGLVTAKNPTMCADCVLHNGDMLPDNFRSFAGNYPLYLNERKVVIATGKEQIKVRMFKGKNRIALQDEIPFPAHMIPVLQQMTSILALNRNEFEVSTDSAILQQLEQAMQGAHA